MYMFLRKLQSYSLGAICPLYLNVSKVSLSVLYDFRCLKSVAPYQHYATVITWSVFVVTVMDVISSDVG